MRTHLLLLPVTTILFLAQALEPAAAQQSTRLLWYYPGVENVVSAAWIEDLDDDATPEILFESYDAGAPAEDHLFAISGRSQGLGTVVWSARPLGGPSNSGGYGEYCLSVSPDLTGDGTGDVLYGAAWGNRSAFLLDGTNGNTIWSFDTYDDSPPSPPRSGWVYATASLGSDVTEDGVAEVLFAVGSDNDGVYLADGATGQILWRLEGQDAFGFVASIDDVDDDSIRDVVALQIDNDPRVYVLSGAGGSGGAADVLWDRAVPGSPWDACEIAVPGEERATLVVGCWDNQLHGFDAATGSPRWNGNVGSYVMRVVPIRDVDGDGIDDIGVGSWGFAGRIHSGADGSAIWATAVGDDCWTCNPVADTNGDGVDDLAVGSFNGRVYLMDGATGAILWNYTVGDKIFTIRGVPDLTGNGIADVVAGTQALGGSGGICYAFEGNDDVTAGLTDPKALVASRLRVEPNPTSGPSRWSFSLAERADRAVIEVYDPSGRRVRTLDAGTGNAGETTIRWDGRSAEGHLLPAGIYLGRLLLDGKPRARSRVVRIP